MEECEVYIDDSDRASVQKFDELKAQLLLIAKSMCLARYDPACSGSWGAVDNAVLSTASNVPDIHIFGIVCRKNQADSARVHIPLLRA